MAVTMWTLRMTRALMTGSVGLVERYSANDTPKVKLHFQTNVNQNVNPTQMLTKNYLFQLRNSFLKTGAIIKYNILQHVMDISWIALDAS